MILWSTTGNLYTYQKIQSHQTRTCVVECKVRTHNLAGKWGDEYRYSFENDELYVHGTRMYIHTQCVCLQIIALHSNRILSMTENIRSEQKHAMTWRTQNSWTRVVYTTYRCCSRRVGQIGVSQNPSSSMDSGHDIHGNKPNKITFLLLDVHRCTVQDTAAVLPKLITTSSYFLQHIYFLIYT